MGGCDCAFTWCRVSALVALVAIVVGFCHFVDRPENFVFDKTVLLNAARRGMDTAAKANGGNATTEQTIFAVIAEVTKEYPKYAEYNGRWLFNNAGGAMGSMTVLHASLSEYLIIFGTPLGTEGHTGRFMADDYFTIIHGEQWAYRADTFEREIYRPGDQHHLPRGVAKQYRMADTCFALELAQGNILSMMFFGLADSFTSTLDLVSVAQTAFESGWGIATNLMKGKI